MLDFLRLSDTEAFQQKQLNLLLFKPLQASSVQFECTQMVENLQPKLLYQTIESARIVTP